MRRWTFNRKLGLGFAVLVVAFAIVAITGVRTTSELVATDDLLNHTHEVRRELAALVAAMVNAETAERGYIITGSGEFLDPYREARLAIDGTYDEIRRLTADNPLQQRRIFAVRQSIDGRLTELDAVIEARRTGGLEAAVARVATGHGKQLMDQLRRQIAEMDAEETSLLETRERAARGAATAANAVILWGSIATIAVTILVGWALSRSLSQQIGSAVRSVQTSATELQSAANQQAAGAREQATAMTQIATTIKELLATSRSISDSAQRVADIARQTGDAARSGATTIERGNEASAIIRRQTDLIVSHMLDLGKKSQQVGAVLDIITELAEQTNIVAINAAIEAAGAGEAGKRFGVVADEIRKLADRVGASTRGIRVMIEDVRGAVNVSVMATETGSKAVDTGAAQVAAMAAAFRDIAALVATTTEAAREIELSTKQQASAVEQVNVAITSTVHTTRDTETSAAQTLQTSSQLTALSTELSALVQRPT